MEDRSKKNTTSELISEMMEEAIIVFCLNFFTPFNYSLWCGRLSPKGESKYVLLNFTHFPTKMASVLTCFHCKKCNRFTTYLLLPNQAAKALYLHQQSSNCTDDEESIPSLLGDNDDEIINIIAQFCFIFASPLYKHGVLDAIAPLPLPLPL